MSTTSESQGKPAVAGLTGGIASGKSSVAREFARVGAAVVDADQLAREVVAPGSPALTEILAHLGEHFLLPDGTLDRKALGAHVFANTEARLLLNSITHPRIAARGRELIAELAAAGHRPVIYEAPLIVENQLHKALDALIVVSMPDAMQIARLMARDGLTREEADSRVRAQLPLAEKIAVADYVIDNSGTLDDTHRQVEKVWRALQARF